MIVFIIATLLACVQAVTAGYYLVQAIANADPDTQRGSYVFASIASVCALFLFTVAVMHYVPV